MDPLAAVLTRTECGGTCAKEPAQQPLSLAVHLLYRRRVAPSGALPSA